MRRGENRSGTVKWVGSGDGRLICLENKKIYSCIEAAGVETGITVREIRGSCEKWIKKTSAGLNFQWLSQYFEENPDSTLPRKPKMEIVEVEKPELKPGYNTRGFLGSKPRAWMKFVYKNLTRYMEENDLTSIQVTSEELLVILMDQIKVENPNFKTTSSGLSRHLLSQADLYSRLFKMQLGETHSKRAKADVVSYYFEIVPGSSEIVEANGLDEEVNAIGSINSSSSMPVIEMTTRTLFSSVRKASNAVGISPQYIVYCCRGDIDYIAHMGDVMVFRYVKYKES